MQSQQAQEQSPDTPTQVVNCKGKHIAKALPKQTLQDKYIIGKSLDSGHQGRVFEVFDKTQKKRFSLWSGKTSREDRKQKYVIKLSESYENLAHEIKIVKKITKQTNKLPAMSSDLGVPQLFDCGILVLQNLHEDEMNNESKTSHPLLENNSKLFGYYIIPQYDFSLEQYMNNKITMLKVNEILEIAIQVIRSLKILHSIGYTHNDIKPGNVMINRGDTTQDNHENLKVTLIDYGFSKKYLFPSDGVNKHIPQTKEETFRGNIAFSSPNQMKFQTTSRRDDIISLAYLLITMLNDFKFPCNDESKFDPFDYEEDNVRDKFIQMMNLKEQFSLHDMSQNMIFLNFENQNAKTSKSSDQYTSQLKEQFTQTLGEIVKEIQSLKFTHCPNYESLINQLQKCKTLYLRNVNQEQTGQVNQKQLLKIRSTSLLTTKATFESPTTRKE